MKNIVISFFILFLLILSGCNSKEMETKQNIINTEIQEAPNIKVENNLNKENIKENNKIENIESTNSKIQTEIKEPEVKKSEEYTLSLVAVGDNLYHTTVFNKGKIDEENYNFDFVYEDIKNFINSFDLAVVNQETVLVDSKNVSSYPCFGTPLACGEALINAGFDIMLGATNHSLDKGTNGIKSTINFWKQHPEIDYVGLNETIDDYNVIKIIEKNNIKLAILNYTYGTNGINFKNPEDSYMINILSDKDKIIKDLTYAKENADLVIVFPHWGTEYVYEETNYQKEYAELFTQYGANLIIGAHPHVVEPVKEITSENGNTSICYYSLGNFVSGQDEKPRVLGGIATIDIKKTVENDSENTIIEKTDFIPSVTHRNSTTVKAYLLKDYTDDLAYNSKLQATPDYLWNLWEQINENSTLNFQHRNLEEEIN